MDRVWKANVHVSPSCPRCGSSNTKFCYYNNYSLAQPRYFCKGCRRYWTKGGSLRNIPVGGVCRKIRRCRSIRISTAEAAPRAGLANRFGSDGGLSASPEGSHIDLALVYANYLNHNSESKGELEMGGERGGSDDQFMLNMNQVEPDIEFLSGNDLIRCEFLSNFFAETHFNNENQISHEGFGLTDTNNYSSPPLPNEEVASWWPDSRTEMTMTMNHIGFFQESDFSDFGSIGLDPSFSIANLGDFDLPL